MDLLSFCREIENIYRMKYSSRQRSHIFSPTDMTLFRDKSNDKRVPPEVRFDGIWHYPLSNLTQRRFLIVVKSRNTFPQNLVLDFTLIVLKFTMEI